MGVDSMQQPHNDNMAVTVEGNDEPNDEIQRYAVHVALRCAFPCRKLCLRRIHLFQFAFADICTAVYVQKPKRTVALIHWKCRCQQHLEDERDERVC